MDVFDLRVHPQTSLFLAGVEAQQAAGGGLVTMGFLFVFKAL